jgi:hypothetical protein
MHTDIRITRKQIEILDTIRDGNPDGSACSVYDLMEKLSYPVKRDALLHSIRILAQNGYVERREKKHEVKKTKKGDIVFYVTTKALELI